MDWKLQTDKFVMLHFFFFFFQKAENNRFKIKPVGQSFVTLFFCFSFKVGLVRPADQQIKLVSPKLLYLICKGFTSTTNLISFFFALRFFEFFFPWTKLSLNSAMMKSNTSREDHFFNAKFCSVSIKLFIG